MKWVVAKHSQNMSKPCKTWSGHAWQGKSIKHPLTDIGRLVLDQPEERQCVTQRWSLRWKLGSFSDWEWKDQGTLGQRFFGQWSQTISLGRRLWRTGRLKSNVNFTNKRYIFSSTDMADYSRPPLRCQNHFHMRILVTYWSWRWDKTLILLSRYPLSTSLISRQTRNKNLGETLHKSHSSDVDRHWHHQHLAQLNRLASLLRVAQRVVFCSAASKDCIEVLFCQMAWLK